MELLKERIDKLERRQEAILNATRWDRFPLPIRNELAEEKREKLQQNPELKKKTGKEKEKEKLKEKLKEKEIKTEERELRNELQQMIFDSKNELKDLYKNGSITHEEAICRYVMIGTGYWFRDSCRFLKASLSEREKIVRERERFEIIQGKIIKDTGEKELNLLIRQQRIRELEEGMFP